MDAIPEGSGRSSQTSGSVVSLPSIASIASNSGGGSIASIASNSGPSGPSNSGGGGGGGGGGGESTPARGGSRRPRKAELDVLRYGESPRRAEPAEGHQARDDSPEGDLTFRHFSAEAAAVAEASGRLGELGDLASPHGDGVEVESGGSYYPGAAEGPVDWGPVAARGADRDSGTAAAGGKRGSRRRETKDGRPRAGGEE